MDYLSTARGLANCLFVQTNATATLNLDDLVTLAQVCDQTIPQDSSDASAFVASITSALPSGIAGNLAQTQIAAAAAYVISQRGA